MSQSLVSSVSELLAILSCSDQNSLLAGLRTLRRQWAIKAVLPLQWIAEEMLEYTPLLRYAHSEPALPHFSKIFEDLVYQSPTAEATQVFLQAFTSALEILKRSGQKGAASKMARYLVKDQMKVFYRLLCANHNAIVSPTLDLLTSMALLDGSVNEVLFASFDFSLKSLLKFAFMRKKSLGQDERHDIRTAYVRFVLSFVEAGNFATKTTLAKMQNLVGPIFAGLPEDTPDLVKYILETCKKAILFNEKGSKSLIISFFYSSSLTKIAKLYESESEKVIELTDSFLHLITTDFDYGLAFKCNVDDFAEQVSLKNRILLDFILSLNPLESLQKQDLCLAILRACPDISSQYWAKSTFSFDPEASARFINLVSFVVKSMAQTPMIVCKASDLSLIIPRGVSAASISRGLTHSSGLIVFFSSLLLKAVLERFQKYISTFEWNTSVVSGADKLFETRNGLIIGFFARIPIPKALTQVITNLIKAKSPANDMVVENLYLSLGIMSKFTSILPELEYKGPNVEASILESLSINSAIELSSSMDLSKLSEEDCIAYTVSMLQKSGFATPEELQFLSFFLSSLSEDQFGGKIHSILASLQELKKKRLLAKSTSLTSLFGLEKEFVAYRSAFSFTPILEIEPVTIHKYAMKSIKETSQANQEQVVHPKILGTTFSSVVEEVLSAVRYDTISHGIQKADFSVFSSDAKEQSNEELLKMLLATFEPLAWLRFLAQLFTQKGYQVDLRLLIENGALAFPIHALTSDKEEMRLAGHYVLTLFYELLKEAKFRERREILLLMEYVKNALTADTRLSVVHAVLVCECLHVLLNPIHFMYSMIMELLLANYSMDLVNVPLLMDCICSSSESMVREHNWILKILIAGAKQGASFASVYQYNHVAVNVETLLQLPHLDQETERLCKQLLMRLLEDGEMKGHLAGHGFKSWLCSLPAKRSFISEDLALALDQQ